MAWVVRLAHAGAREREVSYRISTIATSSVAAATGLVASPAFAQQQLLESRSSVQETVTQLTFNLQ